MADIIVKSSSFGVVVVYATNYQRERSSSFRQLEPFLVDPARRWDNHSLVDLFDQFRLRGRLCRAEDIDVGP